MMTQVPSADDLLGGIFKLGQSAMNGMLRTDSEAAFQEFLKRIPSATNLAAAAAAAESAPAQATTAQVAGYDRWVTKANNASFAAQAAYDELVPAFEALFEREGRHWPRFYDAVRQLTQQPQPERHEALRALLPDPQHLKETPGA